MSLGGIKINKEINLSEIITLIVIFGAGITGWNYHEYRITSLEKQSLVLEQSIQTEALRYKEQRLEDKGQMTDQFRDITQTLRRIEDKLDKKVDKP